MERGGCGWGQRNRRNTPPQPSSAIDPALQAGHATGASTITDVPQRCAHASTLAMPGQQESAIASLCVYVRESEKVEGLRPSLAPPGSLTLPDSNRPSQQNWGEEVQWTRRAFGGLVLAALSSAGAGVMNVARGDTVITTVEADGPDHLPRRRVKVLDTEISYVDVGEGEPVVFLHGNPTWSYQWRNIIPYISPIRRCLAPDLVGMGWSCKSPTKDYRFVDQARYIDAWFEALQVTKDVTLVLHDWGAAIGFYRARRHPEQIKAIAYYEAVAHSRRWDDFPAGRHRQFRTLRSPEGERLVLDENMFVEVVLPRGILRKLTDEEMDAYRPPYRDRERRLPTLIGPRELPVDGAPEDVVAIVDENARG